MALTDVVETWSTGPLLSDSCGYIALDHPGQRVIVAFRGTAGITNTIVDLSTIPQEYEPFPDDLGGGSDPEPHRHYFGLPDPWKWAKEIRRRLWGRKGGSDKDGWGAESYGTGTGRERLEAQKCTNCTVHMGFLAAWRNTRLVILPHLSRLRQLYPSYTLHLTGHSLGGAVAALAGLETSGLGYSPIVTTFGEPRIGNHGLRTYLDAIFELDGDGNSARHGNRYRRVTHLNDPVPLLPLSEWGYRMHAGEIYISKARLSPQVNDLRHCDGDEDVRCIYRGEASAEQRLESWGLPTRYRMWELFFAHRDYFWRIGLCVPGGVPINEGLKDKDVLSDGSGGPAMTHDDDFVHVDGNEL